MPMRDRTRPVSRYNESKANTLARVLTEDERVLNELSERWTYTPIHVGYDEWTIEVRDEDNCLIGHF